MNLIMCNEPCCYQRDGYCYLTDTALITNVISSPCCYFSPLKSKGEVSGKQKDNEGEKA